MPPRTVEIKVDIISDPNGSAKSKRVVQDIEKEVLASQKRVQSASKATDRAISESQKQVVNAAKIGAKQQADKFLQEFKRMETGAKASANSIQSSLKSAFSGGLLGGAVGGFAGSIVGQFSSAISQLPSLFTSQLDEMVRIATERQNAFKGLESLSNFLGIRADVTKDAVNNLRLVRSGIIDVADASTSLRNLLSSGFSLPEATKLLEAFSDTAAFGKSAALGFGEAIKGATEGIRNGNSVLVDNVGLTKNLSAILKDAGFAEKDLAKVKDDVNVRQALFNGLLKEALPQMGDADRLTKGWTGNTAALTTAQNNLYAALGDVIIRNVELNALVKTLTGDLNDLTYQVKDTESGWSQSINKMTSSFSNFIFTLTQDVGRGIANLRDLGNDLDWIFSKAQAVAALGRGDAAGAAAFWQRSSLAGDAKNQNTLNFDRRVISQNAAYQSNQSAQRQSMMGGRSPFTNNPLASPFGPQSNVAFPGMLGGNPGTYAGGGPISAGGGGGGRRSGGGARPRTKSSSVNLNLKDEMSDALDIAAQFGLTITSGKDGRHNAGSAHGAGGAFDLRSNNVHPAQIEAAMRAFRDAGYYVKDERTRPIGQKVWSGPHVHVGGRQTAKKRTANRTKIAGVLSDWTPTDALGREIGTSGSIETEMQGRGSQIEGNETLIEQNKAILDLYRELDDALFNLNSNTEEEILLRKIKLGQYPGLTEGQKEQLVLSAREIDLMKAKTKQQSDYEQQIEDAQRSQQQLFEDTARGFEDMLNDLASGNFKGIWNELRRQMLDMFIKPASQYLASLFGGGGQQGGGFNLGSIFGGGGGLGSIFGSIFGRGGGGGFGSGPDPNNPYILHSNFAGGGGFSGGGQGGGILGMIGGLFGRRGGINAGGHEMGHAGGGLPTIGGLGGGKGIGGLFRGMGGGSMMAGIGAAGGMAASMIGGAIGGPWGNVLQLGGMGASIGAMFGPWGALIGGGIGAGLGGLMSLFNRDNSTKKLKEAALSTYGITIKDKSVLKSLKQLGESMFGKGKAGANAQAIVSSDQGETIIRNYAEATGQSTKQIDKKYYGDENWSGNQFRGSFSGFGGYSSPARSTFSSDTSSRFSSFSPTVGGGDPQMKIIMGTLEEAINTFNTKIVSMSAGSVLAAGAAENPNVIGDVAGEQLATRQDLNDQVARSSGRAF